MEKGYVTVTVSFTFYYYCCLAKVLLLILMPKAKKEYIAFLMTDIEKNIHKYVKISHKMSKP